MDVEKKIVELLKAKLPGKTIDITAPLTSLGIDSLDLVDIIMEAEEAFGISFSNEELEGFKTVKDIIELSKTKL